MFERNRIRIPYNQRDKLEKIVKDNGNGSMKSTLVAALASLSVTALAG